MRKWCSVLALLCMVILTSCRGESEENDKILSYSKEDIYLQCIECVLTKGVIKMPEEVLIFEAEQNIEFALENYENFATLPELESIRSNYPIGKYVYIMCYIDDAAYEPELICKELLINKSTMTIHLPWEYKTEFKLRDNDMPTVLKQYIIYAVLPKEYLESYDFSNQENVIYVGQ